MEISSLERRAQDAMAVVRTVLENNPNAADAIAMTERCDQLATQILDLARYAKEFAPIGSSKP